MMRVTIAALHTALLTAIANPASIAAQAPPTVPAPTRAFAPPEGVPMLLSRTVRRELSDGKTIVATRRYRVTFHRTAEGWTIDGTLVASEVNAPEKLAALAAIERQRPDPGLFPILLDPMGLIRPQDPSTGPDNAVPPAAIEEGVRLITARFPSAADAPTRDLAIQQLRALASQKTMIRWPTTLFLPIAGTTREERRLTVGEGIDGAIVTELEHIPAEAHATMARLERRIETRIADSSRIAREEWTLNPVPE